MSLLFRTLLAVVALACLASCGLTKGKEAASKAVDTYHQQFNDSKFKEIWLAATPGFRASTKEAEHLQYLHFARSRLGVFKSSTLNEWKTHLFIKETVVVLAFNSNFEHGAAIETFSFVVSGEIAELRSYNINLPAAFLTR